MRSNFWFSNNKVRSRLLRMFFILICTFLSIAMTVFIVVNVGSEQLKKERQEVIEKTRIVGDLEESYRLVFFHARGYYAFQDEEELTLLYENLEQSEKVLEQFSQLPLTNEEQDMYEQLVAFNQTYKKEILPEAIGYVEANDYEALRQFANNGTKDLVDKFVAYTKAFQKDSDDNLKSLFSRILEQLQEVIFLTFLLGALLLIFVGIFMKRVLFTLIKPIEKLTVAANDIAVGNVMDLGDLIHKKDELGVLANSFSNMTKSIHEKEEVLLAQNDQLIAQQNERILMYEEVDRSRKLNQNIIDTVNEGIQFVALTGDVILINKALSRMINDDWKLELPYVTQWQWLKHFEAITAEPEELIAFFRNAVLEQFEDTRTMRYAISKQKPIFVEVYATSVYEKNEKIGTMFVHRDITKEHEVDRMKSELVSTVSHELRTPLASILGFTELFLTKELKPERQQKYIETIHQEAIRLTNLINDFLDLQRMESGRQVYKMEPLRINELMIDIVNRFSYEQKHHVHLIDQANNVSIIGDHEKIIQLMINLIGNAIKFSPNGGDVAIILENDPNNVKISIKDEGIGIPKEEIPTLFQKFTRIDNSASRKIGGTGLGLAISKEIVTRHDGDIWIESEEGQGTTVFVTLPVLLSN